MTALEGESVSLIEPGILLRGRYRVLRSLSYGGFGETFEVIDEGGPNLGGDPPIKVLKVLNLNRFYDSSSRRKSIDLFQREAKVLSRLRHPGIPQVDPDGYFTWPDQATAPLHCLVMECIEGQSLDAWLRMRNHEPLDEALAFEWLRQLVMILQVIHDKGLIHRDIKPSNIMLTSSGQLVLIDFGAVREATTTYLQGHSGNLTGTRIFAAGYTPHEQAEGRSRPESDFFAIGRTFVHLLSGVHPMGLNIDEQTGKLVWRDRAPHISDELADLLDHLMEPFPGNRPRSARQILSWLGCDALIDAPPSASPEKTFASSVSTARQWRSPRAAITPELWSAVRLKKVLREHEDQIRAIAIRSDSRILISGSYDGNLKLWALPDGQLVKTLQGHIGRVSAVATSADGALLASGGFDRQIRLWSLYDGELLHVLPRQSDPIQTLAFHPEKLLLASASGTTVHFWSGQTGGLRYTLPHCFKSIRSLAFNADGRTIAVGSLTGTIEVWNIANRKRVWRTSRQTEGMTLVTFSPDGALLASAGGANIELISMEQKRSVLLETHQPHALTAIAFSPDGQVLATASGRNIDLWHVAKQKRLSSLPMQHQRPVRSLAFTLNGQMIISASSDRTMVLWQPARL